MMCGSDSNDIHYRSIKGSQSSHQITKQECRIKKFPDIPRFTKLVSCITFLRKLLDKFQQNLRVNTERRYRIHKLMKSS